MLAKRLYRMLLRGANAAFLRQNKEFLVATLEIFQTELVQLSTGTNLTPKLTKFNPQAALKQCFREGVSADVDILLGMLPRLLRYLRASRLLTTHDSSHYQGRNKAANIIKSHYNTASGALLVSRLFYTEQELQSRHLQLLFDSFLRKTAAELQKELDFVLIQRRNSRFISLPYPESLQERRRQRVFSVLVALDRLIKKKEQQRVRGQEYEHLVDQIFLPDSRYLRGMPITYSVLYCSLLNALDGTQLMAFGIAFPKHFLSRLAVQQPVSVLPAMTSAQLLSSIKGDGEGGSFFINSETSKVAVPTIVATSLTGSWVCVTDRNFFEVSLSVDTTRGLLLASLVSLSVGRVEETPQKLLWSIPLTPQPSKPSNFHDMESKAAKSKRGKGQQQQFRQQQLELQIGRDYSGILCQEVDVTPPNDNNSTSTVAQTEIVETPCTLRIMQPSAAAMNALRSSSLPIQGDGLELQIRFRSSVDLSPASEQDNNNSNAAMQDFSNNYCRLSDLDNCLIDFSDGGVVPITPATYLTSLRRDGYRIDHIAKALEPATSAVVAARMAANLARSAMRGSSSHAVDNAAYWGTIRRALEQRIKDAVTDTTSSVPDVAEAATHSQRNSGKSNDRNKNSKLIANKKSAVDVSKGSGGSGNTRG